MGVFNQIKHIRKLEYSDWYSDDSSDYFLVIKGWCNSFLSFHSWKRKAPIVSFGLGQKKKAQKSGERIIETSRNSCAEKRKELQTRRIVQRKWKNFKWGGVLFKTQMNSTILQSRISLSSVVEFLSFSDDPVLLFNFLKTSPFPSNFIFN